MSTPSLKFDIRKDYPGFSLDCKAELDSEVTAIFGPSGGGKTTLLNCIAGMIYPEEGEILFQGETLFSSSERKNLPPEKRRFGYVFQDSALFPNMSVHKNILYGYNLTPSEIRKTDPNQLIDLLGLSQLLERKVGNLSGGERQRVALARALATSPRLLLLDEPLASLDGGFRGVIIEYLKKIRREIGIPMIFVSHSISEVMALADSTLVISNGKRIVQGQTSLVLANENISSFTDYASLENLLEAEVISTLDEEGLTQIRVGDSELVAPETSLNPGDLVTVSIRAGDIIITRDIPPRMSARNILDAKITEIHEVGSRVLVYADIGERMIVEITPGSLRDLGLHEGQDIHLIIKTNGVMVLDAPNNSS